MKEENPVKEIEEWSENRESKAKNLENQILTKCKWGEIFNATSKKGVSVALPESSYQWVEE